MSSDMQDKIKEYADNRKISVSKLIRDLIEKYVLIEDDSIPVVLRVPNKLKADPENLHKWLETKVGAIVNALTTTS